MCAPHRSAPPGVCFIYRPRWPCVAHFSGLIGAHGPSPQSVMGYIPRICDLRYPISLDFRVPSASPVSRRILRTQRFQRHICRSADATSLKSVCQTVGSTVARTVRRLIRSIQIDTHRRSALTRKVSSFPCEHAARCWDSLEWDPLHPSLTPPPRFVASVKTQSGAIRRKVQLYAARVRPSRPSHR